jgi:hypothetical protein
VRGISTIVCGRFLAVSVWRRVAAILRNSIKVPSDSAPRTRNNSGIEFQGNVIAIVLFAALRRRHSHYFSNYDVSRLSRNPYYYFTQRRKMATKWVGITQRIYPLPNLVDLTAMRKVKRLEMYACVYVCVSVSGKKLRLLRVFAR